MNNPTKRFADRVDNFLPLKSRRYDFPHERVMDFEGLKGLLLSASYMPNESHPRFGETIVELRELFSRYQNNNAVKIEYVARVYCGRVH